MAKKGSLSLIELHVEKLVLGLAAAFAIGMGVYYLMGPNKIEYSGQKVGPGELDEAVLTDAQRLDQSVRNAKPKPNEVPNYRAQLEQEFAAGILKAGGKDTGPALPEALPIVTNFGQPLPTFDEDDQESRNIQLVTPLRPVQPAARTGISVVAETPAVTLGGSEPAVFPLPTEGTGTTAALKETSWVSVAWYFPVEAERREMVSAGYAGYRSKPYLVGVDVQRQEMLANGEWSEWTDVHSPAMPDVKLPTPAFDDNTGEMLNQSELDALLERVKANQPLLYQPPFYPIASGDEWAPPPLAGHEDKEEVVEEEPVDEPKPAEPAMRAPREAAPARSPTAGGGGRGGGGGGRGRFGGGGRSGGGRAAPAPGPQQQPGQQVDPQVAARKEIREHFAAINKALRSKNFEEAIRFADMIRSNGSATKTDKRKVETLLSRITKAQGRAAGPEPTTSAHPFVLSPEGDKDPALWFHDVTVEPGKTYRYRMRALLWNRYLGRAKALRDPGAAREVELVGDWSLPGEPVTVAARRHFFVTGQRFGEPAARVDVFTWHHGDWLKETFDVKVGDVIGATKETKTAQYDEELRSKRESVDFTTDAVVLDLRFDEPSLQRRVAGKQGEFAYSERDALVLVYLDPADGQIKERVDAIDRTDRLYRRLKQDYEDLID